MVVVTVNDVPGMDSDNMGAVMGLVIAGNSGYYLSLPTLPGGWDRVVCVVVWLEGWKGRPEWCPSFSLSHLDLRLRLALRVTIIMV